MSLLDQWDRYDDRSSSSLQFGFPSLMPRAELEEPEFADSGYVSVKLEEAPPIFSLKRIDFGRLDTARTSIKCVAASSSIVVIGLSNAHILKCNQETDTTEDIELSRKNEDTIHKVFIDPSGAHIIVSLENGESVYLSRSKPQPRPLSSKLKGLVIESVGWERPQEGGRGSDNRAITALIGTRNGLIFECSLDGSSGKCKQVYEVSDGSPVLGIQFDLLPSLSANEPPKFLVMAVTNRRYFHFVGGPSLEDLFSKSNTQLSSKELPGEISHSELHFFYKHNRPSSFIWLTGAGLYHGSFKFSTKPGSQENIITEPGLISYPVEIEGEDADTCVGMPPLSVTPTEFHYLLLYCDHFSALSSITHRPVLTQNFEVTKFGMLKGFARDPLSNTVYAYSNRNLYEVAVVDESRDVWRELLERNRFTEALRYAQDNPLHTDQVRTAHAEHLISEGQFKQAAQLLGLTRAPLEEVSLRFLQQNQSEALMEYLTVKLNTLQPEDRPQRSMLCTWLTELHLDRLNSLKAQGKDELLAASQEVFRKFLKTHVEHLSEQTTMQLIESHGRFDELVFFAELLGLWRKLITHLVSAHKYTDAIEKLVKVQPNEQRSELLYKFAPVLLRHKPKELVDALIKLSSLDPLPVLPALAAVKDKETHREEVVRYLEFCVLMGGCKEPRVHNLLLSLYAQRTDERSLLKFLEKHKNEYFFDVKYALRVCSENHKYRACVHLYGRIGMFEEAVDLSLTSNDLTLAKRFANGPDESEVELRKRLWLRIAKYVLQEDKDVSKALSIVKESELLGIEGLLPYLSDFVLIDNFKEEICDSLEDYNRQIEGLREDMEAYTKSAELVREDIKHLRNRSRVVREDHMCEFCSTPALSKPFFLFPCSHAMHFDCLMDKMKKAADAPLRTRLAELEKEFNMETSRMGAKELLPADTKAQLLKKVDDLKSTLDSILASECFLCGSFMIKSVKEPFISTEDRAEVQSWAID
eukprot:GILI01019658.1.p1 GENE.GILI01019658.1~~GILI01019658.1.p1  ORF type:complete len:1004 (-),score=186.70 GILI01019658.1:136-3078(-)